jgi:flagellar motor switch protein FliG
MAGSRGPRLPETVEELDGVSKAAILLLSVDRASATAIMANLPLESVTELSRQIASLGPVPVKFRNHVISEFYTSAMANQYAQEGGLDYARTLLVDSMDPKLADKIIAQIQTQVQKTPFNFLQKAESENLLTFIQDEHPQTIALIVSHLAHHKAAEILIGLPATKQIEVVKRVANMEQTNPEVIQTVEKALESRLSNMLTQRTEKTGGVETVAEMLNLVDRSSEKAVMEGLEAEDPDLVEQIRRLMFVFEDVILVDDRGIQAMLKEVDNEELALAMRTASEELKEKVFKNMSERAAILIKEDMEYMGPVRVSDVESAQQRIVDIVRRLEDAGEIIISGRGDKDLVV